MIGDRIIALLAKGPMHTGQICEALDLDYTAVTPAITACVRRGLVVTVGKAVDYGCEGVKATAPMYALPGTEHKPAKRADSAPMSDRIREALAQGPATAEELAARLRQPTSKVRQAVVGLTNKGGGVVTLYALYRAPERKPAAEEKPAAPDEQIRVAQRITIPQYRYGASRRG